MTMDENSLQWSTMIDILHHQEKAVEAPEPEPMEIDQAR